MVAIATTASDSSQFVSENPGRDAQRVGTARFLGQDPGRIHQPVWAVTGTLGDSQCYLGVVEKVGAVQRAAAARINADGIAARLIAPAYSLGVSDGQLNGTDAMRYSLIGRELVHDTMDVHLSANSVTGLIAVVACDKPPVGTLAAVLEHNAPAVLVPDGPIRPGVDPETGERLDIITAFQIAGEPAAAVRTRAGGSDGVERDERVVHREGSAGRAVEEATTGPGAGSVGLRVVRGDREVVEVHVAIGI